MSLTRPRRSKRRGYPPVACPPSLKDSQRATDGGTTVSRVAPWGEARPVRCAYGTSDLCAKTIALAPAREGRSARPPAGPGRTDRGPAGTYGSRMIPSKPPARRPCSGRLAHRADSVPHRTLQRVFRWHSGSNTCDPARQEGRSVSSCWARPRSRDGINLRPEARRYGSFGLRWRHAFVQASGEVGSGLIHQG
jgi:hypothetical protein